MKNSVIYAYFNLILAIIILTGTFCIIYHNEKEREEKSNQFLNIQRQAISNNFAHWEVNLSGEVTFKWNVPTNNVVKE
jgi:hypothetical protein